MARTQAPDYEERREGILDRAAALFAKRGFDGTSVADLAQACGTSKSLIYHYYPSKEDMLFEVMEKHVEALVGAAEAARGESGGARERLGRLTHALMRLYVGAEARHKVLLNELDKLAPDKRAEVVARQRQLIGFVEELIGAIEPALAAEPARLRAAAMLYFGMINWTHTWFRAGGPVSPDALADMVLGMLTKGLPGAADQAS